MNDFLTNVGEPRVSPLRINKQTTEPGVQTFRSVEPNMSQQYYPIRQQSTNSQFSNPFSDSKGYDNQSRVTASGFTSTIVQPQPIGNHEFMFGKMPNRVSMVSSPTSFEYPINQPINIGNQQSQRKDSGYEDMESAVSKLWTEVRSLREGVRSQIDDRDESYSRIARTVNPNDSVSVIQSPQNGIQPFAMREEHRAITKRNGVMSPFDGVVVGYQQTPEEQIEELDACTKVQEISGMPIIFTNMRLNLLTHLHSQLFNLSNGEMNHPCADLLTVLTKFIQRKEGKSRTPTEELLYSVIRNSISFSRKKVIANPYHLPVLEVGMVLNERLVQMCFGQLYVEYQTEWFQSMKDVTVPKFHSLYKNIANRPSHSKQNEGKPKRRGSSVVSYLRS